MKLICMLSDIGLLRYTHLEFNQNFVVMEVRANERILRMDKRKDKNYIPLVINDVRIKSLDISSIWPAH